MQVARWLSQLPEVPPVGRARVGELLAELDRVAAVAIARLAAAGSTAEPGELRMPKSRLAALGRCERSAVALAAESTEADSADGPSLNVLRGIAYDRFVIHQLHAGRVLDPVADLRSMLTAEAEWPALAALDQLEATPGDAEHLLEPVAATVADAWSGIDPGWLPRTQSRATITLSESRVVCSGVVDVELGGQGTEHPSVVVEVKSAAPGSEHVAEVAFYALLVASRDGVAPSWVARWYPGTEPAAVAVTDGLLESAARRLADGITRWAELEAGRTPAESAGPWCRWCPDAAICDSAAPPIDEGDTT